MERDKAVEKGEKVVAEITVDNAIELALRTWRDKEEDELSQIYHATMALAGEVGEWVNLQKKHAFKPGYKLDRDTELDELGDIWYYLRILYHLSGNELPTYNHVPDFMFSLRQCVRGLILHSGRLYYLCDEEKLRSRQVKDSLIKITNYLYNRLDHLEFDLDKLTELNWEKLKPGSKRGNEWKD